MTYKIKEIFYTLQGEGMHTGRPAVFCRFASCNLWTGREADRSRAVCKFCDTDFVGTDGPDGGRFDTPEALAGAVAACWPDADDENRMVVCTGGEPLLQLDEAAVAALHRYRFYIAVETNGTHAPPPGIDWLCVSPKIGADLVVTAGNELKLVYPQIGGDPSQFEHLQFDHLRLQPLDDTGTDSNVTATVEYCLKNPRWKMSLQTHKYLGIR